MDGSFEAKQTDTFSKEGVNLRDLIRFAAGKADGEDVTSQDFGNLLSKSGVSGRDATRLSKAFETVSKNDKLDYLLSTSGDSFNVFDKSTGEALTKSSRKTGSTKGVNLADLIGLGDNVSKLVGFASNKIGDYIKPKGQAQKQDEAKVPNVAAPTTDPATLKTGLSDYAKQSGKQSQGKSPLTTKRPLDNILNSNLNMRQMMLNPQVRSQSQDELPQVALPSINADTRKKIQQVASEQDVQKLQREYSTHLKDNYSGLYEYITGKNANPSSSQKLQISGELGKLKSKQTPMYQYLMKYHRQHIDKLNPNLKLNGSY